MSQTIDLSKMNLEEMTNAEMQEVKGGQYPAYGPDTNPSTGFGILASYVGLLLGRMTGAARFLYNHS